MRNIPKQEIELLHKPFVTLSSPLDVPGESELYIRIGRIPHPMENSHHIEWIEVYQDGKLVDRVDFDPRVDRKAEMFFSVDLKKNPNLEFRAKCNLHGIWSTFINKDNLKDLEVDHISPG